MDSSESYRRIRRDRDGRRPKRQETWAAAYVSLRKALGFKAIETEKILRRFLRFMCNCGVTSFDRIDRGPASAWLRVGSPQESTIGNRLRVARGLFRYLLGLGVVGENVWDSFQSPKAKRFIPYIFSLAELRAVLGYVRGKISPRRPNASRLDAAYHAMFHTLYACGLRSGEVCRLSIGDVDSERNLFVIRETKFGKTRLVPFNSRTREFISEYLQRFRRRDDGMPPDAPLFLNQRRRRFVQEVFSHHFARVCAAAGVYQRRETRGSTVYGGTTPHALRHTFAVHRLLKWYEEGTDVNAKLPLLATYMGHTCYWDTQYYLTILPRFIDIAGRLFSDRFESPLKDLE